MTKFVFPAGAEIAANGYLIIWADGDPDQAGLHADFKLSAGGESVFLVDPAGTILDEVTFFDQTTDISYGRFPNGTGDFRTMSPTFNGQNSDTSDTEDTFAQKVSLKAIPNPASDAFYLEINDSQTQNQPVLIYDMSGRVVYKNTISHRELIDASNWISGVYVVRVGDSTLKMVIF